MIIRLDNNNNDFYIRQTQNNLTINTGGQRGVGVPTGGNAGQVLAKVDSTDYRTQWVNQTGLVYNVKDFGALGDGVADDTTALQTAINAAGVNGGVVFLPVGTYLVGPLTLPSFVLIKGAVRDSTIIKLKDEQDADLIRTTDFNSLTGTDTTDGQYGFGISGVTLDGNKANNTGGNVISIYGYGYLLQNVNISNGSAWGSSGS